MKWNGAHCCAPLLAGASRVVQQFTDINTWFGYDPRSGVRGAPAEVKRAGARWGVERAYAFSLSAALYDARHGNAQTLALCERDGFFRPVAVLSPLAEPPEEPVAWVKDHGFAFVRIFPDMHGFVVDGPACRNLLEACSAAGLPVMVSAMAAGPANLWRGLDGLEGVFIITDNRYGVLGEVLALAGRRPGVCVDVGSVNTPDGIVRLAEAFGVEQLLWGSGYPGLAVGCGAMLLQHSGLPPEQIELIAHGNAGRLLEGPR